MRQQRAALIWMRRTRPDIGLGITKLPNDAVDVVTDPVLGRKTIQRYREIARFAHRQGAEIGYADIDSIGDLAEG